MRLVPELAQRYTIVTASRVAGRLFRAIDILMHLLLRAYRGVIIVDTYSTSSFLYTVLVAVIARVLGVPYIPVLHGGALPRRLQRTPALSHFVFHNAHALVSPSRYLEQHFLIHGFRDVHYIPNIIELQRYSFRQRHLVRPRLIWVRSLHALYNPCMAIRVLHLLKNKFSDADLLMIGPERDGSLAACRTLAMEIGVAERVEFTGILTKEEWIERAANRDVFINTTHADNLPVSLIEAMALGLPIVSTDVGGIPFMLRHQRDALLVKDDDHHAMAAAIERLIGDPHLVTSIVEAGYQNVQQYSWEHVAPLWYNLLDPLVAE